MAQRTHACGAVTAAQQGQEVVLKGWVQKRRDLGGLIFVDMRDREGIVQVVFGDHAKDALAVAEKIRNEYVIEVAGKVVLRDASQVNKNMKSGEIEVLATSLTIINEAKNPPFAIDNNVEVSEELRLKYRYLDLRRPVMYDTFKLRSDVTRTIRNFLQNEGVL